jgi:hypothetical protein
MPDLDGPRERIRRANGEIVRLQNGVERFFGQHLYEIGVAERHRKQDEYSLRVEAGPQTFPVDWSLTISEVAHHLRAALDGMTWQLALLCSPSPYDRTAFPIYLRGGRRYLDGKNHRRAFWHTSNAPRVLQTVPKRLWTQIELFQPYKRGNGNRHSPLHRLEELSNSDKHRLLTVVAPTASALRFTGHAGHVRFNRSVTLRVGAKIGWVSEPPPNRSGGGGVYVLDTERMVGWKPGDQIPVKEAEMSVNVAVAPGIRFGDTCEAVARLPVIHTLQAMANEVSRIVEAFAPEF